MTTQAAQDSKQYPVLRNLQFAPIQRGEEQFIVLWDPTGLGKDKLVLPMNYFFIVQHFDGQHSLQEISALYLRRFGELLMPEKVRRLVMDLDERLFLEGDRTETARCRVKSGYRQSRNRQARFAGLSYEAEGPKLAQQIQGFFTSDEGPDIKPSENRGKKIKGLIVPTYDLKQAGPIYAWAYKELQEAEQPELYIVLGTAYAGLDSLFAATDKDFDTPLGLVSADKWMLGTLRGRMPQVFEEDFVHQAEHAIEFQLPFLQQIVGTKKPFSFVPILCSFSAMTLADPPVRQVVDSFLNGLHEILQASCRSYCIVAAAELAHLGMRYGDKAPPTDFSFHRSMQQDLEMLKHVEDLKSEEFARYIQNENDRRRISGFSPIYSLLRLMDAEQGQVLRYDRGITDQYNSTVTYASMAFF